MGVRPTNPNPLDGGKVERWLYCAVPNGTATVGFLAAPPTGFYLHHMGRVSKPCRVRIDGCPLSCPYCVADQPTWRGYTPFYSREYRRMFVLIPEDIRDAVCEIEPGSQVKLSREKDQRAPVLVRPDNWRLTPLPDTYPLGGKVNLVPFLLRLWKDEELTRWHYATEAATAAPPVADQVGGRVPVSPEREAQLMGEQIRARFNWPGKDEPGGAGPQLIGDVLDVQPSPNGKPKKR